MLGIFFIARSLSFALPLLQHETLHLCLLPLPRNDLVIVPLLRLRSYTRAVLLFAREIWKRRRFVGYTTETKDLSSHPDISNGAPEGCDPLSAGFHPTTRGALRLLRALSFSVSRLFSRHARASRIFQLFRLDLLRVREKHSRVALRH